jgi:hypothetical protein
MTSASPSAEDPQSEAWHNRSAEDVLALPTEKSPSLLTSAATNEPNALAADAVERELVFVGLSGM